MRELKILSPTAILGYGFPMASWEEGMRREPDVIAVDAGSTDPGPYYLGAGISFTDREAVKRDLGIMIPAALARGIPVIIGSAGGSGGAPHLQWNREIIAEIAAEKKLSFPFAVIPSDIGKEAVSEALRMGKITPLHPAPALTQADIDAAVRIVAQMGTEPIIQALADGAQVILTGRAYDPAVFAALAVHRGYDKGLAIHLGKILECAAIAATPGSGSDCMFGYIGADYFRVEPLSPVRKCTTLSVAAHTLYEKTNPYILPGPGGTLDLRQTVFTQETDAMVRVSGSRFIPSQGYTVKLEGVKKVGCRTVSFAAAADPVMIAQIDEITPVVKARVADNFTGLGAYFLDFKIYGRNEPGKSGVMGIFGESANKNPQGEAAPCRELAIIIDAVASTQELANTLCSFARSTLLHYGYPGRISTAGNLAFPFSPSDIKMGDVYAFCVYHLMEVDDPCGHFPVEMTHLTAV
ncbi:MAG: DUF1446 domain-containing protein [Defluviitaleaceae bacterium]|nr:DUF1446 domain-containing protein [Defluviitaleaceae bacterium]MCL2240590.1 DUF1446 domain-containing protein [Defluviitaleaceae bacterium]